MSFRVVNGKITAIEQLETFKKDISIKCHKNYTFQEVLEKKLNDNINISKHAQQRLKERNIVLNEEDIKAINNGINLAEEKGSQESLILYKDTVFIASVKNRTIITAFEKNNGENVFTNIDSVVLI